MVQIRASRTLGNPEHLADLGMSEAFHIVQYDHRALTLRQCLQSCL
jgi:hypothetical protein